MSVRYKILVAHSGGLDSTVLLFGMKRGAFSFPGETVEVEAAHFDYGQRHLRELTSAVSLCHHEGIKEHMITIPPLLGGCLVDRNIGVPEGKYDEPTMKQTVVPGRNLVFASLLANRALTLGFTGIALAVHQGDHAIYPDCRPRFIEQLQECLKFLHFRPLSLETPFLYDTKADIVKTGRDFEVPMNQTWTCYKGGDIHCGVCGSCNERKEAFRLAGCPELDVQYAE